MAPNPYILPIFQQSTVFESRVYHAAGLTAGTPDQHAPRVISLHRDLTVDPAAQASLPGLEETEVPTALSNRSAELLAAGIEDVRAHRVHTLHINAFSIPDEE
jgi:hypothetical protein